MTSIAQSWRRLRRRGHDAVLAALRTDARAAPAAAVADGSTPQPWLSALYGALIAAKRSRELAHAAHIADSLPVISVGNFTFGATGKTPCVLLLTALALKHSRAHGRSQVPMLLTRGYGDDEWRLFQSKFPTCALAVGSDRLRVGRAAVDDVGRSAVSCVILDDGLQQWRIRKDVEVVMVDALHPFGNGRLLPCGSLRELPRDALARADIVIVHHADLLASREALEALKRALLAAAALSARREALVLATSRMRVKRLVRVCDLQTREDLPIDASSSVHAHDRQSAAAAATALDERASTEDPLFKELRGKVALVVCGVGSPESVRRVVEAMGCWHDVAVEAFPDHHAFSRDDLRDVELAAAALAQAHPSRDVVVVTTEKDFFRTPALIQELASCCDVRVLECALELQENAERVRERVLALLA